MKEKQKNKKINKKLEKKKSELELKSRNSRLIFMTVLIIVVLILFLGRLSYLQFVKGAEYKEEAVRQQTLSSVISPSRGTIYDSTGKALAISAEVDTVTINPANFIVSSYDQDLADFKTLEKQELVAKGLSEIFELNYDDVYAKVTSTASSETIIKKVERDKIEQLEAWMQENEIKNGINIDDDVKRYYPYGSLASNLIGFCGTDNTGLEGLEYQLNDYLTGTPGRKITAANAVSQEIPNSDQLYIPAENGSDVILTLDYNIQAIAEKYLEQAVKENECSEGGNVVIMDPSNGDVLAMATYPNYNLNTPFVPNTPELAEVWDTLPSEQRLEETYSMWQNPAVFGGYEPGSTFKILTAAIGLEENLVDADTPNAFLCEGVENIYDTDIKCWRSYNPHGYQTLTEALENSCNPAFIQLSEKIGVRTFYEYLHAFGLMDKTGALLTGESNSVFHEESEVGPVELATLSFGQRFTVTPLQLVTALSSLSNDGLLMEPRIVKQFVNTDTNIITTLDPVSVRQVISPETTEYIKSMLESVVTDGTGKYAAVEGYSIGGKTGTSEPSPSNPNAGYVASYYAIAPVIDTKVSVLLTLYDPQGYSHEGGAIAAPVISQILSEVLPYLGISSDVEESNNKNILTVPDVTTKTLAEATKVLEEAGFNTEYTIAGDKNTIVVTSQTPKPGSQLEADSTIFLYTEENPNATSVVVPDLKGKTLAEAKNILKANGLNYNFVGSGNVVSQDISAETLVPSGTIIRVTLKAQLEDTY